MAELDASDLQRIFILVLWNNEDSETRDNRELLDRQISEVFQKRPSDYFRESIETKHALMNELGRAMQRVLIQMIQSKDAARKLETGAFIEKPVIHGPGGRL
jgi:hypothetical protein